jgi:hypothetical protein
MPPPWHTEHKVPRHPPLWPARMKETPAVNASATDTAAYPGSFNPFTGMNWEPAGVDTLLVAARPDLAAISSTLVRCGLGQ